VSDYKSPKAFLNAIVSGLTGLIGPWLYEFHIGYSHSWRPTRRGRSTPARGEYQVPAQRAAVLPAALVVHRQLANQFGNVNMGIECQTPRPDAACSDHLDSPRSTSRFSARMVPKRGDTALELVTVNTKTYNPYVSMLVPENVK
jgi:hypothetical protein